MKKITDRNLVRQYLLGKLDEQAELEDNLSDGILFNDEMTDIVDSVEDEIIEEYLEGSLDSADRDAVDKYFLQPPERKEKLRFAKLLRRHFDTKPSRYSDTKHENLVRPPVAWLSHFRTYGQLAALVLVSISSLVYVTGVRRSHARLQGELAQERGRSASLLKQTDLLQPPMVSPNSNRGPLPRCWHADSPGGDQAFDSANHSGHCPTRSCLGFLRCAS